MATTRASSPSASCGSTTRRVEHARRRRGSLGRAGSCIPAGELEVEAVRSGGPGGQNVNKVASQIQLRFSVRASRSLTERGARHARAPAGPPPDQGRGDPRALFPLPGTEPQPRRCPSAARRVAGGGSGAAEDPASDATHAGLEGVPLAGQARARRAQARSPGRTRWRVTHAPARELVPDAGVVSSARSRAPRNPGLEPNYYRARTKDASARTEPAFRDTEGQPPPMGGGREFSA